MELYDPQVIRAIKNRYGFRFSKSLGQNFLTDSRVLDDICDGADLGKDDLVIEIGPGIGTLTRHLSEYAGKVVAVEIDPNLITVLADTLADRENVRVVHADVLKTDIGALVEENREGLTGVKIVGNLPYYITTPVIMKLLEEDPAADSITVMMQKEVADRIKSPPGGRTYGALSVAVQYRCDVAEIRKVGKECFMPSPKVDSEILRLDLLKEPAVRTADEKLFFRLVKAGFAQRRKTLANSLSGAGFSKDVIRQSLQACGIDEKRRAETLSLQDLADLTDHLVKRATDE